MLFLLCTLLLWVPVHASTGNLPSTLAAQPSLTKFTSLMNGYTDLLAAAQAGDMTIIAPNDDAFTQFFATPSTAGNYSTSDQLYALISYHILKGTHTQSSITSTPKFFTSLLTNSSYTNVTTGQVVEAITNGSTTTFESAVHQVANMVGPIYDIVFLGGLIHIVDAVLVPPIDALATVTEYPLPYFIDTISPVLNNQYLNALENLTDSSDMTLFAVNNKTVAQYTLSGGLEPTDVVIDDFLDYSAIPGHVLYSTDLTNGSTWPTVAGVNLTITVVDGDTYVNSAKITASNLLVANGVLHVIDNILNASDPGARPELNTTSPAPSNNAPPSGGGGGLSTGAQAGIGVGVAVVALAAIATLVLYFRRRRTQRAAEGEPARGDQARYVGEKDGRAQHEKDGWSKHEKDGSPAQRHELITKSYDAQEMDAKGRAHELDSSVVGQFSDSSTEGYSRRAPESQF